MTRHAEKKKEWKLVVTKAFDFLKSKIAGKNL